MHHDIQQVAQQALEESSGVEWKVDGRGRLFTFISLDAPGFYDTISIRDSARGDNPHFESSGEVGMGSTEAMKDFMSGLNKASHNIGGSMAWMMENLGELGSVRMDSGYQQFLVDVYPSAEPEAVKRCAAEVGSYLREYVENFRRSAIAHEIPPNVLDKVIDLGARVRKGTLDYHFPPL